MAAFCDLGLVAEKLLTIQARIVVREAQRPIGSGSPRARRNAGRARKSALGGDVPVSARLRLEAINNAESGGFSTHYGGAMKETQSP